MIRSNNFLSNKRELILDDQGLFFVIFKMEPFLDQGRNIWFHFLQLAKVIGSPFRRKTKLWEPISIYARFSSCSFTFIQILMWVEISHNVKASSSIMEQTKARIKILDGQVALN